MKKKLSFAVALALAVAILMGFMVPVAGASSVSVEVVNPLAEFAIQENVPLNSRDRFYDADGNLDLNGKRIGVSAYMKVGNGNAITALLNELRAEYPGIIAATTAQSPALGSPWNPKSNANYTSWANLDAVIFGVADCNVCCWWSAYHCKEVESRGGVAVIVAQQNYARTHTYAAVDNGFTEVRRVVLDSILNSRGYQQSGSATSGTNAAGIAAYRDYVINELPVTPDYVEASMYTGDRAWLATVTPYEQLKWALFAPLTEREKNPPVITQETFNEALAWKTKTFTGATYEKAAQEFNTYAMDNLFSDGLPLVLPTPALVAEMLAGTTRDKDEVLGMMKMRGGIITIEKIAVNAVMAGAKPEHLPVLIAAMEAYGNGWENDKMWYHNMSTGAYSVGIMMILNGPLAKELGIADDRGYMGSGHEANNLIGRAFRLCVRNIGHNYTPHVDTQNRVGRLSDHTLLVFAEQEEFLPAGWLPHHVQMGYDINESTITMIGSWSMPAVHPSEDQSNNWTPANAMLNTRENVSTTANLHIFPPGVAALLANQSFAGDYYMPTKNAVREWWATHSTAGAVTARSAGNFNASHVIVAGGNPNYIMSITGFAGLYGVTCYQTQLISGATLTTNGRGATVPSTPVDFEVLVGEASGVATLVWDEPLSDGGSPITGYQYNIVHGGNMQASAWTNVPGGAAARSIRLTGLSDGQQYFFKVRATNAVVNASEMVTTGNGLNMTRASGRGAWALADDVRTRPSMSINFPGFTDVQIRYWTNGSWKTLGGNYNWYTDNALFDIPVADYPTNGIATIQVLFQTASPTGHYYTFSDIVLGPNMTLNVPLATVTVNTASAGRVALVDGDWVYHYEAVAAGDQTVYLVFDNEKRFTVRFQPTGGAVASQYAFAGDTVSFP